MLRSETCLDRSRRIIHRLIVLILFFLVQGCAPQATRTQDLSLTADSSEKPYYWWTARYQIAWPEGAGPDWRVDLLLADAVVRPVLNANRQNIRYWRFHRRALHDDGGHLFGFLFYADRDTAGRIYASLKGDKLTGQLMEKNVIRKIITDNPDNNHKNRVQDTSDKTWEGTLQIAWPAYIMGVSDMWLQLIEQNVADHAPDAGVDELLEKYGNANDRITALWRKDGQHAFLHHLNAIFGYEPIIINKAMQF